APVHHQHAAVPHEIDRARHVELPLAAPRLAEEEDGFADTRGAVRAAGRESEKQEDRQENAKTVTGQNRWARWARNEARSADQALTPCPLSQKRLGEGESDPVAGWDPLAPLFLGEGAGGEGRVGPASWPAAWL